MFALAACSGGGSDNGDCGDGHVTGSEQCDDGNSASGDGCSSSCKTESLCGNGVYDVATETCDDGNTTSGDGCSSTCQKEGTCGNGFPEPGETCDDGNTDSQDGCNGGCQQEVGWTCTGTPSVCVPGDGTGTCAAPGVITFTASGADLVGDVTGDTTGGVSSVDSALCDGGDSGAGPDNIWSFTISVASDVSVLLTPDQSFDGGIRLLSAVCDLSTEITDQYGGDDGCSDYYSAGEQEFLGYTALPAGTYYVLVDGFTDTDEGSYSLEVTASPTTCGDGAVSDFEQCDDGNMTDGDGCTHCTVDSGYNCDVSEPSVCQAEGCGDGILQLDEDCDDDNTDPNDGCSATCTIEDGYSCSGEPSVCVVIECQNGIVETGEECDDGNAMNGDRCDSNCVLEQDTMEAAEPNDTTAQMLSAGNHIIRGSYEDGDVDLYKFTLTATSKVEIETYSTINGSATDYDGKGNGLLDCTDDGDDDDDPDLALFALGADTTDDAMAIADDDLDGDAFCAYLGDQPELATLAAGTYVIRVTPYPFAAIAPGTRYMLDLKISSTTTAPVAPGAGDLVINEFLAADGGATTNPMGVDSNCDGVYTNSDDEFIELYNPTNKTLDLTGVTYSDKIDTRFTFAPQSTGSLTLAPHKAVVVWGGGAPKCAGVTNFFTNGSFHSLSLNDAGDTITITGADDTVIATTTYGTATVAKSFNLSPDLTGTTYALHNTVNGAVGNLSPGKKVDGSAF